MSDPMTVYFTADHHLGHENIIKYCGRPSASAGEMNAVLVTN
jgi:calcineurin-like phosphoesterase family protein